MPRRVYTTLNERVEAFRRTDVYPVVTSGFCAGRDPVAVAASLLAGGARILQIREKTMPDPVSYTHLTLPTIYSV